MSNPVLIRFIFIDRCEPFALSEQFCKRHEFFKQYVGRTDAVYIAEFADTIKLLIMVYRGDIDPSSIPRTHMKALSKHGCIDFGEKYKREYTQALLKKEEEIKKKKKADKEKKLKDIAESLREYKIPKRISKEYKEELITARNKVIVNLVKGGHEVLADLWNMSIKAIGELSDELLDALHEVLEDSFRSEPESEAGPA
jgi:hypothetical protein